MNQDPIVEIDLKPYKAVKSKFTHEYLEKLKNDK
jgi:hypothetical protein